MRDIFMSYAREDAPRVRDLALEFERLGWTVWYDREIGISAEFDEEIERELDAAACVVVVWSRSSVKSRWVRAEAGAADDQGKLIPVTFEPDVLPPLRFRQLNVARLSSTSLESPTEEALSLLAEISSATGKLPRGLEARVEGAERAGGRSGARTVTAGTWRLTSKYLWKEANYEFELFPSGIVSGKGAWWITRAEFSGRWHFDSSRGLLQLEMSGGVSEGIQSMAIQIERWEDDDTALCTFDRRKARLRRLPG
jgi:hypothetical protein